VLRSWHPLKTAVESQWGGHETSLKAEELRKSIFDTFDFTKKPMDASELEEELFAYMEEEFSVVLEDGSEREVSRLICEMYDGCRAGNVALARETVSRAEQLLADENYNKHKGVVVTEGELDEDDDDETMMDCTASSSDHPTGAEAYAQGMLFGGGGLPQVKEGPPPRQLGEVPVEKAPIEMDDDGFAPVTSKKGRRNRSS